MKKKLFFVNIIFGLSLIFLIYIAGCGGGSNSGAPLIISPLTPGPTSTATIIPTLTPTRLAVGVGGGPSNPSVTLMPTFPPGASNTTWTYMVYLGADNNLADYGLMDINEMEAIGSNANISIAVQAEFDPAYSENPNITDRHALRFYIENDGDLENPDLSKAIDIGDVKMTDHESLTDFINWASSSYPADHYVLVIWDHGNGWRNINEVPLKGAITDSSGDIMSLVDIAKAVRNSNIKPDIICFDACVMAMYEVLYEFKGLTDYMVFSEDNELAYGYPYDMVLSALASNPDISPGDFAIKTSEKFCEFYAPYPTINSTMSAVDMSYAEELNEKVRNLGTKLNNASYYETIETEVSLSYYYGFKTYHDIYQVCNKLTTAIPDARIKTAAEDLKNFISTIVISNESTGGYPEDTTRGLSIYFPISGQTNAYTIETLYEPLACNQPNNSSWQAFLKAYLEASKKI